MDAVLWRRWSDSGIGGLHSAHYDFNDEILATGAQFWIRLVRAQLAA